MIKIKNRKSVVLILLICFIFCQTVLLTAYAFSHFKNDDNGFSVTKNYTSEICEDSRSGIRLATSVNNALYGLGEMSGLFEVETRPLSEKKGESDFSKMSVFLRDKSNGLGLELYLEETIVEVTDGSQKTSVLKRYFGVSLALPEKCIGRWTKAEINTTFSCEGDIARFGFDAETFEVFYYKNGSKSVIVDLDNKYSIYKLDTLTTFSGFNTYSAEIAFSGIQSGKSASAVFYSLNGQDLSGETLINNTGATICGVPELSNGIVNTKYDFKNYQVKTYDVIDGIKDGFTGDIVSISPSGKVSSVVDYSFTPDEIGKYRLDFTATDDDGIKGKTKSVYIDVLATPKAPQIDLQFEIEDCSVGVGETVYLPSATATSDITLYNGQPSVTCNIYSGDNLITEFDYLKFNSYTFTKTGEYRVEYSSTDVFGNKGERIVNIRVENNQPVFEFGEGFSPVQPFNESVNIPSAKANGIPASFYVVYPDGRATSSDCVKTDVVGTYSIYYSVKINDITYERVRNFTVNIQNSSLFENVKGVSITNNYTAPDYAADDYSGVLITANRVNAKARFTNTIDLKDNTKDDTLIEFFIAPEVNNTPEFYCLELTLTDIHDENNSVNIKFVKDEYADRQAIYQSVCANKEGVYSKAITVRGSFWGMFTSKVFGIYPAIPVNIQYDYATNSITTMLGNSSNLRKDIVKLDDENQVGSGNAWHGFTTGECYLTITFQDLCMTNANLMILNVDGQDLSGEYAKDGKAPNISLDLGEFSESALPHGVVNKAYPLFGATADDLVCGKNSNVDVEVYYLREGLNKITPERCFTATKEAFVPQETGKYLINYSAVDLFNNRATRSLEIEVDSEKTEVVYEFSEDVKSNAKTCGEVIRVIGDMPTGGNGLTGDCMAVEVLYKGNEIPLNNGCFIPTASGEYTVNVKIKDYLKQESLYTKTLTVNKNLLPVIVENFVPVAVINGREYQFESWYALDYQNDFEEVIPVTITVDGNPLGNDGKWTPDIKGEHSVCFEAKNVNGTAKLIKTITSLSVDKKDSSMTNVPYLTRFFLLDDTEVIQNEDTMSLKAVKSGAKFSLATPVYAGFYINLTVPKTANNFTGIKITVQDSKDESQKLEMQINKNIDETKDRSEIVVDGARKELSGSFYEISSTPFVIEYNNLTFTLKDYKGNQISVLKEVNGKAWKGFTSNQVYITVEFVGVTGDSVINVNKINNQTLNSNIKASDKMEPIIVGGEIISNGFGEDIVIKPSYSYDVLSQISTFYLTLKSPSKRILLNKVDPSKEYVIKAEEYGSYYIEYYSEDSVGNANTSTSKVINVSDTIPPTITLNAEFNKTYNVGSSIKVNNVTVKDNYCETPSLFIWLVSPNGLMTQIEGDTVKIDTAGRYQIVYVAYDDFSSTAVKTISIEVV